MKKLMLLVFVFSISMAFGQLKVGNNAKVINPNSLFELESNNKGMLLPRLALVATDSTKPLTAHIQGMIVYNLANSGSGNKAVSPGYYYNDGAQWVRILGSVASSNTTAGQLVTLTNGTGATLTNMQIGIDTTALKTFVNGRTTVSNAFNASTRALSTTVNGITGSSVTIPTTNDSTTASNGLTLNGKDVRLGGTLNTNTTITQGSNLMRFTGAPSIGNSSIMTLNNTATGSNGTVLLDMLTPNSDVSYYRIGKSTTFGNSAEITFRTVGNNSDSNSLSLGFFNSQYLVNLTKNGNLGIGSNLFVPTQKLDVDGGARIRSLASGSTTDSIVTVDANGVLRRRSISAVVSGDNWGSQTVAVSAPLSGNGTSGSPLSVSRANTTAANNLVTVTNGTNATFTAMTVGIDTTNLKSFLNNNITVSSNAPLSGNGTTGSPLSLTTNNTTAGQLVNITNGTGATMTNMQVGIDTTALKTFVNGRTTVSNAFNTSTRALSTTVNGITGSSVTIPTTIDSTTASNGLTLNGKDVRFGGTLNTTTTINQGSNSLIFNATPTSDFTAGININNNATGNAGATVLNMISPNSDTAFYRIGKSISTGNVAEISYTHRGTNNDTNRLSFGFHSSRYLLNLMKNGNLSVGNTIATEKLDVDGGARIRSLASGSTTDSIVTVDANGVLRRRSISAVVSGDNWGSQTVAVSAPLSGNGTSGSPLSVSRANTSAANNLVTVTNGTNATFTSMTVGVDTTNLKSFLNNKITVTSSAPLSGNGTTGSPLSLTTNNTTAGQLVNITNGTGATMTNMQVGIDTMALKTFVNGRTTVSNAFNTSTRALSTTVNGITGSSVTIPTTIDSTTASNGLTLNGKDVRLGGALTMPTTITQGSNLMTYTGSPVSANFSMISIQNMATGSNGTVLMDMLTPNSNVSYYRLGKSTTFGNSAEITFRSVGNNNDSNSLSLGFFNSQYLLNLTKNGNLGIGANLFVPTQKLDVDGGARIRSLASGAASDSIVTVDGSGVLRRRNLSSIIANIYNTDGTLTGERTVTNNGNVLNFVGNGTSGFPIRLKSPLATSSEVSIGIYDRNSDTKGWMIGSNTYNGVANTNGNQSRELHFATLGFANAGVKMKIDSAGNVAIGRNTDPAIRLAVQGGISLGNGNFLPDTAFYRDENFVTFRHNGTSEDFIGYRNNTFYFADCPGGSDVTNPNVMVLGNLGVGNTTPSAKLHVNGNARITSMSLGASTDSIVVVDHNGELKKRAASAVANSNQLSLSSSATVPALSLGDVGSVTITVTGAAVGDGVIVNPTSDLPAGVVIAYSRVSVTNTVKIGFTGTGSSSSFTQTFDIKIIK